MSFLVLVDRTSRRPRHVYRGPLDVVFTPLVCEVVMIAAASNGFLRATCCAESCAAIWYMMMSWYVRVFKDEGQVRCSRAVAFGD